MDLKNHILKLYREKRVLALLEWAYLAISVVSFVIAGVFALFNQALGLSILIVPFAAFIAFAMNIVAWALVKLAVDSFLPVAEISQKPTTKSTTKSSTKSRKTVKAAKATKTTKTTKTKTTKKSK